MNNKTNGIILCLVFFTFILPAFVICCSYIGWRNSFNKDIIPQVKQSEIFKSNFGQIKKINNSFLSFPKELNEQEGQLQYRITTDNGKYDVIVAFEMNPNGTFITGYLVEGKRYNEIQNNLK